MYRIGEFSKLSKTTVKTLRYYDEVGLLSPSCVDEWTNYRYYTTSQLNELQRIISLRQAGLSISEIKTVLSGGDAKSILESRRNGLEMEKLEVERSLSGIAFLLKKLKEDSAMDYQVVVKDVPEYTVYYKRGKIKDLNGLAGFVLGSADECVAANPDIKCIEPDYCFVSYTDSEYVEEDMQLEYAQAVDRAGKETETIKFRKLKPVRVACTYHKGGYSSIREAYAFVLSWIEENGYRMTEPVRERYIDGVWNKESEDEWLTEIQVPVEVNR